MTTKTSPARMVAANVQLPCAVPGCDHKRDGLSRYCQKHKLYNRKYGDPLGEPLVRSGNGKRYASQLQYTHELIIKHIDSRPIQAALKSLKTWVNAARGGMDVPGGRLLKFIESDDVVTNILTEVSAAYIYLHEVKRVGHKQLRYGLANSLYYSLPRVRQDRVSANGYHYRKSLVQIGSRDRDAIGNYLLDSIGIILENIRRHYVEHDQRETDLKKQMHEEF